MHVPTMNIWKKCRPVIGTLLEPLQHRVDLSLSEILCRSGGEKREQRREMPGDYFDR